MLTTILIFLPIAGALFVWIVPWPTPRAAGGAALLIALAELVIWVNRALNFDYGEPGLLQDDASHSWFSDLGVSYTVGLFDFSLWLVGLTVVVTTAAVAYGFWSGRERMGVYLGLLLFLEGATVGVFTAQDLLLFYVFWEAMMIPLYILIGVWGGPGRFGATIKFVIYTLAGSLLMLVSVIALGLSAGTFDMTRDRGEREHLDLPRLRRGVRRQGADLAVPRLAPGHVPRSRRRKSRRSSRASSRRRPRTAS